jgi:hypothetical protein
MIESLQLEARGILMTETEKWEGVTRTGTVQQVRHHRAFPA